MHDRKAQKGQKWEKKRTLSFSLLLFFMFLLQDLNHENFDFAFVDADKLNYAKYHEKLLKLLKIGGMVVYDNTLWVGTVAMAEESVPEPLRAGRHYTIEFNKLLAADTRVQISHVPVGDGITICKRVR